MTDWNQALIEARNAHADLDVDAAALAAHVDACRAQGALAVHLGDVVLAFAAAHGAAEAVARLDALVGPDVDAAARRVDRAPAFADELRQAVRVRLFVAPAGGRARLLDYVGRGPLRGWVGVVATRAALNLKRDATVPAPASADVLEDLVAGETDPELRQLKNQHRAEFRAALTAALAALSGRDRALLRLTFVEGVRQADVARLYGVHESTASRWLHQATRAVADDARQRLVECLGVSPATADSVARLVLSNLDLSIARLLREPDQSR
jgi:RNA polymerase sigma-70 factor (ECF subfamily)